MPNDRRKHVRGRPRIDLPAEIELSPPQPERTLHVVDISLGGIGVWVQIGPPFKVNDQVTLRLTLGPNEPIELGAVVRYRRGPQEAFCGMRFDTLNDEMRLIVGRYVGELVERGSVV